MLTKILRLTVKKANILSSSMTESFTWTEKLSDNRTSHIGLYVCVGLITGL